MTRPRFVRPGITYLVTRRITQRQFWLRPSAIINQLLLYCLAFAAKKYGIEIHVACFMSNHWHAVVTDVHGNMPLFLAWFHKNSAGCVNELSGREENLWANKPPDYKELADDKAILAAMLYCMSNPVEAELVDKSSDWPGYCTQPADVAGFERKLERPSVYFSPTGKMPASETLTLTRPPMYMELSDDALIEMVAEKLEHQEQTIRDTMKAEGRTVLGVQAILNTDPSSCPSTPSKKPPREPRRLSQFLSVAEREARKRRRDFLVAYDAALQQFKAGNRDVVFPAGTYALVRRYGVAVEPYQPG